MTTGGLYTTKDSNTPSIIVGDGASAITVLSANDKRIAFSVQNVGTTAAYIRLGSNASGTVYHYALKGGSSDNDGTGGSISFTSGVVYNGIITVFGASTAKVVALEIAP